MSDLPVLDVRPYQLMCAICSLGCETSQGVAHDNARVLLEAVRGGASLPLRLRCNVDSVHAYQNPGRGDDTSEGELYNEKRDLDILQKLGLVPGDARPARELFLRLLDAIASPQGICGYGEATSRDWSGCPRVSSGDYERGHALGLGAVVPPRDDGAKAAAKERSAPELYDTVPLQIRPHHLMCMACFHGGRADLDPIAEDNLFEAIEAVQKSPNLPITLVRGCCMICPPCSQFDPATQLCVSPHAMGLRDQKKDLDVLQLLGLQYGDTLPARELYGRLFAAVEDTTQVCGYGDGVARSREWSVCRGSGGSEQYRLARAARLGLP
ncbi:hypothetical protein ACFL6X_02865 [Candidatus Latescibacterota bacterium]